MLLATRNDMSMTIREEESEDFIMKYALQRIYYALCLLTVI